MTLYLLLQIQVMEWYDSECLAVAVILLNLWLNISHRSPTHFMWTWSTLWRCMKRTDLLFKQLKMGNGQVYRSTRTSMIALQLMILRSCPSTGMVRHICPIGCRKPLRYACNFDDKGNVPFYPGDTIDAGGGELCVLCSHFDNNFTREVSRRLIQRERICSYVCAPGLLKQVMVLLP